MIIKVHRLPTQNLIAKLYEQLTPCKIFHQTSPQSVLKRDRHGNFLT